MIKALGVLRNQRLLSSKSYGVAAGHGSLEYFWALRKHPIVTDLGLIPPKAEVHSNLYEHEKLCADVFVALYRTGSLHGWGQQRVSGLKKNPDRIFYLGDDLYFLEAEMGNHKEAVIREKVEAYKNYYRTTHEQFQLRFLVKEEDTFNMIYRVLENETHHYQVYMLDALQEASKSHSITRSTSEESEIELEA